MAVELLQTGAVERTVRLDPRTKLVLLSFQCRPRCW